MSKKSRSKKRNKQKIQKSFSSSASIIATPEKPESENSPQEIKKTETKSANSKTIVDELTRKMISKDVKMIVFTLFGLVLILITVKVLQQETGYISTFSDWLYKIANIQTR